MTDKPWMPLYVAEYRADTAHLSVAEHGAYLLLIMHYWQTGSLPTEDAKLARIACMSNAEWRKARPTIAAFFLEGWKHKRVEEELARAAKVSEANTKKATEAANRRWLKHSQDKQDAQPKQCSSDAPSIPQAMPQNAPSQLHSSEPNGSGEAADPKIEFFRRGRQVLGPSSGGLLSKLLKSQGPEDDPKTIAKARARIEDASTKAKPSEWIGRILSGPAQATMASGQPYPDGII